MGAVVTADLQIGEDVWIKYDHPVPDRSESRAVARESAVKQRFGNRYGFEFSVRWNLEQRDSGNPHQRSYGSSFPDCAVYPRQAG
jgi:hypothetical protein